MKAVDEQNRVCGLIEVLGKDEAEGAAGCDVSGPVGFELKTARALALRRREQPRQPGDPVGSQVRREQVNACRHARIVKPRRLPGKVVAELEEVRYFLETSDTSPKPQFRRLG